MFSRDVTAAILVSLNKEMWPCWCPQVISWELNSILMQTFSFVLVKKRAHWSSLIIDEWKHAVGISHSKEVEGEGWKRKWGPKFFLVEHEGPWKVKRRVGGSFFNKSKKLSFAMFWYYVEKGVLNNWRGYPNNMNGISLGSGNFLASETFSPPPPPT